MAATYRSDKSGVTSVTAGTFTDALPVYLDRGYLRVSNPNASGFLYIYDKEDGTPNAGINTINLSPGDVWIEQGECPASRIRIAGSVASLNFECAVSR